MGWNYRVVRCRRRSPTSKRWEYRFAIHEAYYDGNGLIWTITEDAVAPSGETMKELKDNFSHYMAAFSKPVLDEWKLPEKGATAPAEASSGRTRRSTRPRGRGSRRR